MKKVLLILLLSSVISCSSDNDSDMAQDLIIGEWKPIKTVEVYTNGDEDIYTLSECESKSIVTIEESGHFFVEYFEEIENGICEQIIGGMFQSGSWTKLSEYKYRFEYECYLPDCDETLVEIPDKITFPTENSMIVRFNEDDDDDDDDVEYYYYEYVRNN